MTFGRRRPKPHPDLLIDRSGSYGDVARMLHVIFYRVDAILDALGIVRCTPVAARWCPIHGNCRCACCGSLDDRRCPLHSPDSTHGEP